jgi:hypothetical protein
MNTDDKWIVLIGGVVLYWWYSSYPSPSSVYASGGDIPPMPVPPVATIPSLTQDVQQQVLVDANTGKVLAGADAIAAGAGATIAGSSGIFLGLSATAWTLIGAAVAGVIALVFALRSKTHLYANEIVQHYENPFGQYVIQIITHMDNSSTAGTLTCSDSQAMIQAVETAWQNYQDALHQLMNQSTDWLIVAKQSLNNLDNQYRGETLPNGKVLDLGMGGVYPDGFMTHWIQWMHQVSCQ